MLPSLPYGRSPATVLKRSPFLCSVVLKFSSKPILGSGRAKLVKINKWLLDKLAPERTAPTGTDRLVPYP